MEAAAEAEGRRGKDREAVVGHAEMEMEVDAGAEAEEAREEGEIEGEGDRAEEEMVAVAVEGNGDSSKRGEYGAVGRKGGKKRKLRQQQPQPQPQQQPQPQPQPRTPGSAGSRASCRGRGGGRGRGGFHHRPWNLRHHQPNTFNKPGVYGGAIMLCNRVTKRESFQHKLFGLPGYAATFIKKIRAGMLLFVFEREERKLYGVFEATSDGALNILPNAFPSLLKLRPAQICFRRVWFCKPLTEAEFSGAIKGLQPHMSFFGISYQQVLNLVHLFSPKRIRLQPYQKPKSRVIWDYKISLAHTGLESSLHTHSHACPSSSMFCNSRISLPHSSFMYAKQNAKHAAYKSESPLRPRPKSVIFKAPDIKEKGLELNADYIPLELDDLDDCKSDSDAVLSNMLGTVSFYSALLSSISYEDRDPKPFNGKRDEGDGYHSPVLNRRFISESETGQNSAIAHIMKERLSSMQGKGCKRKVQFDEHSDLSSPSCTMAKKVFFNFGGDEISVTSDKALQRPAHAELEENREAIIEKRKREVGCLVQDNQSKGGDVSTKRSKLMSLSFPEGLTNQRVQSCSRNSQSLVTQSGIKLTYTLLTDEE